MTSLHWVEFRFLVPPPPAEAEPVESRCSAISSEMKVFRSTSWRPLRLLLRHTGPEPEEPPPPAPPPLLLLPLTCVGEPGAPERTLILAMAPLRPGGWRRQDGEERAARDTASLDGEIRQISKRCSHAPLLLSTTLMGKVTHYPKFQVSIESRQMFCKKGTLQFIQYLKSCFPYVSMSVGSVESSNGGLQLSENIRDASYQ